MFYTLHGNAPVLHYENKTNQCTRKYVKFFLQYNRCQASVNGHETFKTNTYPTGKFTDAYKVTK